MDSCRRYQPIHIMFYGRGWQHTLSDRNSSQRNIPLVPTSAVKSEERLQTAQLETRKLGSFIAVCSIAAQALNSSTNHLEFKALCHIYSGTWYLAGQATTPNIVVLSRHYYLLLLSCTSITRCECWLQTAKLESRKLGSFVAVCSIAAQALYSSTNHLGFKA